jgi:hypothetical protein
VLLAGSCGSSKKSEGARGATVPTGEGSHRLDITVNIDGKVNEWPQPLPGYSKETALHFGITNNQEYLFVAVACNEDRVQRKMLRSGMELYISENGKKQTLTGIGFPLPSIQSARQELATSEIETPERTSNHPKSTRNTELTQMQIFGLSKTTNGVYPIDQTDCKVAYNWSDNNFFNIEYAIPLKEVFPETATVNNSNIQIGLKLNAFAYSNGSASRGASAGGRQAGYGGGMRGGGMRGGGMRGGGMRQNGEADGGTNSMTDVAKDQTFWTKYSVSK